MRKYIFYAALAFLGTACSLDDHVQDSDIIRVNASLPVNTRATSQSFELGDVMGLYAVEYDGDNALPLQIGGNFLNNEKMTYDGSKWESSRTLYWSTNACDFYAIYPYQELESVEESIFEISADQSTERQNSELGGYEKSDLMWAKAEKISRTDGKVNLQFRHMMSRVVVKIVKGDSFEGDIPDDVVSHIYNTATTAKVNYKTGSLEKYAYSKYKTITMRKVSNDTFEAVVVPQFIENLTPLVEITMGGISYLLNCSVSLRPGYQHTISATLLKSPEQENIEISISGEVNPW